jgi:hypothetical protein
MKNYLDVLIDSMACGLAEGEFSAEQIERIRALAGCKERKEIGIFDNELLCGYTGGCGERMNRKCDCYQKCEKWTPVA